MASNYKDLQNRVEYDYSNLIAIINDLKSISGMEEIEFDDLLYDMLWDSIDYLVDGRNRLKRFLLEIGD